MVDIQLSQSVCMHTPHLFAMPAGPISVFRSVCVLSEIAKGHNAFRSKVKFQDPRFFMHITFLETANTPVSFLVSTSASLTYFCLSRTRQPEEMHSKRNIQIDRTTYVNHQDIGHTDIKFSSPRSSVSFH